MATLRRHREALARNPFAYELDRPRLSRTVVPHLKRCGYLRAGRRDAADAVDVVVGLLFEAQGRHPMFSDEGPLPYCWNRPQHWELDYIRYEWGHLNSRNQNEDADGLTNLSIQSARCNQHIQTSMDILEVKGWLAGSAVDARIDRVLDARARLFASSTWQAAVRYREKYR